jgi:hypothetical protein
MTETLAGILVETLAEAMTETLAGILVETLAETLAEAMTETLAGILVEKEVEAQISILILLSVLLKGMVADQWMMGPEAGVNLRVCNSLSPFPLNVRRERKGDGETKKKRKEKERKRDCLRFQNYLKF